MKILVVNAGSSSHKLSLFDSLSNEPAHPLWTGHLDWGRGQKRRFYSIQIGKSPKVTHPLETVNTKEGLQLVLESLWKGNEPVIEGPSAIACVGHRVVHGGSSFQQPIQIQPAVKEQIRRLIPLAPLHNPANLEGIELFEHFFPSIPHYAVFDTAFHLSMPDEIKTYPVPQGWKQKGVQRYGFHGISHQYCAERMLKLMGRDVKIINCHLGNGASLCAIQGGKSVETTMGLTPLEGLMMGTRCGSIDPGILLYMMREQGMSAQELDYILNFESGLKGIAGHSDMREILDKGEANSQLALKMYLHRLKAFIAALTASLEGVEVLSFTGGVGENASFVREQVCQGLAYLGVQLDEAKNRACQPDQDIAMPSSAVRIWVVRTQEEWMIARLLMA